MALATREVQRSGDCEPAKKIRVASARKEMHCFPKPSLQLLLAIRALLSLLYLSQDSDLFKTVSTLACIYLA